MFKYSTDHDTPVPPQPPGSLSSGRLWGFEEKPTETTFFSTRTGQRRWVQGGDGVDGRPHPPEAFPHSAPTATHRNRPHWSSRPGHVTRQPAAANAGRHGGRRRFREGCAAQTCKGRRETSARPLVAASQSQGQRPNRPAVWLCAFVLWMSRVSKGESLLMARQSQFGRRGIRAKRAYRSPARRKASALSRTLRICDKTSWPSEPLPSGRSTLAAEPPWSPAGIFPCCTCCHRPSAPARGREDLSMPYPEQSSPLVPDMEPPPTRFPETVWQAPEDPEKKGGRPFSSSFEVLLPSPKLALGVVGDG